MKTKTLFFIFAFLFVLSLSNISALTGTFNVTTDAGTFTLTNEVLDQVRLELGVGLDTLAYSDGYVYDAKIVGDVLFMTAGSSSGSFSAFDISNPSSISLLDTDSTLLYPKDFSISDGYAYIASNYGIYTIDVSTPSSLGTPTLTESLSSYTTHDGMDIEIVGTTLYEFTGNYLMVINITSPGTLAYVDDFAYFWGSRRMDGETYGSMAKDEANNHLFIAASDELFLWDISSPFAPSGLDYIYTEDGDSFVEYGDGVIATHSVEGSEVNFYTVSVSDELVHEGTFSDGYQPFKIGILEQALIHNGLCYINTWDYGITILNVTDIDNFYPISQWNDGTYSIDGAIDMIVDDDGVAYFASGADDVLSSVNFSQYSSSVGTYRSKVFDATAAVNWEYFNWSSVVPSGATSQVRYRSCNDAACSGESFGSYTSTEPADISGLTPNRWFQFEAQVGRGTDPSTAATMGTFTVQYSSANSLDFNSPADDATVGVSANLSCDYDASTGTYTDADIYVWYSNGTLFGSQNTNPGAATFTESYIVDFTGENGAFLWTCEGTKDDLTLVTIGSNRTLNVDSDGPEISYIDRTDDEWLNYSGNVSIFATPTDSSGVDVCSIYHNFTGGALALNYSADATSGVAFGQNYTLADGIYDYYITCNDSLGNVKVASTYTLGIDTVSPNPANITAPENGSSTEGNTVTFDYNVSDDNIAYCRYTVTDVNGTVNNDLSDVYVNCSAGSTEFAVTQYGDYTLEFEVWDYALNRVFDYVNFTTIEGSGGGTGGGGGGGSVITEIAKIPVVALQEIVSEISYSDLDRAIIFAMFNNICASKAESEEQTLAIQDYTQTCELTLADIQNMIVTVLEKKIDTTEEDLVEFYTSYRDRDVTQIYQPLSVVTQEGLFTSVLGIVNPLTITPPRVDKPTAIFQTEGSTTIEQIFTSNKEIKDCLVISGGSAVECEVLGSNTFKVVYYINDVRFFDGIFRGEVSIISDAQTEEQTEVKSVVLYFRVYNLAYKFAGLPVWVWGTILLAIGLIALVYYLIRRDK